MNTQDYSHPMSRARLTELAPRFLLPYTVESIRSPRGKDAFEVALRDFDRALDEIGHRGQYFAVAHVNESFDDARKTRVHVHAIVDYSDALPLLGKQWGDVHGMWKAGFANVGAFYYVARHACDGRASMRDRMYDNRVSA